MPRRPGKAAVRAELDRIEKKPAGMTAALYRRFDAEGRLLYVGVSEWPYDRAVGHGMKSLWVQFAAAGINEWFATRVEALRAETIAIREELPLFNRMHSAPGAKDRLVQYLINQGRQDLVDQVAAWAWSHAEVGARPARWRTQQ